MSANISDTIKTHSMQRFVNDKNPTIANYNKIPVAKCYICNRQYSHMQQNYMKVEQKQAWGEMVLK